MHAMITKNAIIRTMVKNALEKHHQMEWTAQGFGMLRTYLDPEKRLRLNIWDKELQTIGVSLIHTHPWSFLSCVVSGRVENTRYEKKSDTFFPDFSCALYNGFILKTGIEGGKTGEEEVAKFLLQSQPVETYYKGETYYQQMAEIHKTNCSDGAVTINDRTKSSDGDTALAFYKVGEKWVAAKPRIPSPIEVRHSCEKALEGMKN